MKRTSHSVRISPFLSIVDFGFLLIVLTCGTAALAWVNTPPRPTADEDAPPPASSEEVEEQIAALQKRITQLERELDDKETEANQLQAALNKAERERPDPGAARNQHAQASHNLEEMRQRIDSFKKTIRELQQQEHALKQEKDRLEQLRKTIDETTRQVLQLGNEFEKLKRDNKTLASDVEELGKMPIDRHTVRVDFHPRFNLEEDRKLVLVVLAEGMVTPLREPYYTSKTLPGEQLWSHVRHAETIEQALTRGSVFLKVVEEIDRNSEYVFLWVDSSSFETFRKVREALQQRKVPFGWNPSNKTANIAFVPQGGTNPGTIE